VPYPRRLLYDDEVVLVEDRPHPVRLVRPIVMTAVVVAGVVTGFVEWRSAPAWFGVALGAIAVLAAVVLAGKVLAWRATLLVLTSSRVIYRTGVLRRIGREIPIDRVQDVTYQQGLLERIVGAGTLTVESAGERGVEPFFDIRRPEVVQSQINRAVDAARHPRPVPPNLRVDDSIADRLERLTELHHRGVLTDAEYADKRRELLERM